MMLESRRRPAPLPAGKDQAPDELLKLSRGSMRSQSSLSTTPTMDDDDDDVPRRSTRGRNPLPPSSGPLFPPLPPKQPKNSPKNSPMRSPAVRPPATATSLPTPTTEQEAVPESKEDVAAVLEIAPQPETEGTSLPSGSAPSLTPPPASEPAIDMDEDMPVELEKEEGMEEDDKWESYRRSRQVRSFGTAKPAVKLEPNDEDEETTPGRAKPVKSSSALSVPTASGADTPASGVSDERADSVSRSQGRKRRGEEQLLLDDHLLPEELRRIGPGPSKKGKTETDEGDEEPAEEENEEEAGVPDVTRCVCQKEDGDPLMIQCDKCNVWQHGPCVGIWADEEAPDEYYCEECRPDLHGPLRKWLRRSGRNPANFLPPTPDDLKHLAQGSDKHFPSQSKMWADIAAREKARAAPRSHHRKEAPSPVDSLDARRSGRRAPSSNGKPVSSGKKDDKNKPSTHKRRVSIVSVSPQRSVSPPHPSQPAKRRSTMNSRDAAYEEQVKAALEASRLEAMGPQTEDEDREKEDSPGAEGKERAKGKRKLDDAETPEPGGPGPSRKIKHPNQYTYRPKPMPGQPAVAASPSRKQNASTPVPTAPPPQHEHGTRRQGAIANGLIAVPAFTVDVNNLSWHLPDHLSAFADLLPSPHPTALNVRTASTLQSIPRNHFNNQHYGPFSEERDDKGKLVLSNESVGREVVAEMSSRLEAPARIKYPPKRITTSEMRKRVRLMLDFVSRIQVEEARRKQRAVVLGIDVSTLPPKAKRRKTIAREEGEEMEVEEDSPEPPDFAADKSSSEMMDELVRDLIAFQESLMSTGFASPLPPPLPTFENHTYEPSKLGVSITAEETEAKEEVEKQPAEVAVAEEPIEVYREGEVSTVVAQPEEVGVEA